MYTSVDNFAFNVDNLDFQAVLGVIIEQRTETVGTLGDDPGDALFAEHLHVGQRHLLENILVTQPAQAVPAAKLVLAQHAPADTGLV